MTAADYNDNDNKVLATINWNNIVNQDARSIDDAPLGKVQGLFKPFVVTEKDTINKEKYYIPKSLIERYDREILYFGITEQEANVICRHDTPPSDDKTKQIQTVTENLVAFRNLACFRSTTSVDPYFILSALLIRICLSRLNFLVQAKIKQKVLLILFAAFNQFLLCK